MGDLLTTEQAARILSRNPRTLENWRSLGRGPDYVVNPDTGRFHGYTWQAIDTWITGGTP
jgi:hypothetical protein